MKRLINRFQLAIFFSALLTVSGAFGADTPLQTHMKTLAGNLKTVQTALKSIAASPSANHDADWTNAKNSALVMAQAAGEASTLFPPNVAGNPKAESAFTAAVVDLQSAIQDQLVTALDRHELNESQAAVQAILDKKADGHNTFIPDNG